LTTRTLDPLSWSLTGDGLAGREVEPLGEDAEFDAAVELAASGLDRVAVEAVTAAAGIDGAKVRIGTGAVAALGATAGKPVPGTPLPAAAEVSLFAGPGGGFELGAGPTGDPVEPDGEVDVEPGVDGGTTGGATGPAGALSSVEPLPAPDALSSTGGEADVDGADCPAASKASSSWYPVPLEPATPTTWLVKSSSEAEAPELE
jgi:hypothetical protein